MFASLGVGVELYRDVRGADRIRQAFPVFPLEEVIGQESPVLVNPLEKCFHRFPTFDAEVCAMEPEGLIGDLLRQGVVKDIFNFRNTRPLRTRPSSSKAIWIPTRSSRAMCSSTRKRKTRPMTDAFWITRCFLV